MLCVMIAAEQPRLSIQSKNTTQNNQKILKSKQQQQLAKEDIDNSHHQQQQHNQNHNHQNINNKAVGVQAASVATTTPILNTEKKDETRSEKKVPTTGHLSDSLKVQSGSSELQMVTSATNVGLCDGNRIATTITTTAGTSTTRKTINCLRAPVTLQMQPPQVQMQPPSTKIQQKQQRFLAAAAKSATSPPDCATAVAPAATAAAHTAAVVITGITSKRPTPQTTVSDAEAEVAAAEEALAAAVVPAVEAAEVVASVTPTTLSPPIDQQHQTYQVQSLKQTPSAPPFACCKAAPATISQQHSLQQNHNLHNQHHHHQQQQQHLHNNHHQPQQQHHHHLQQYHHHLHQQHPSQPHQNYSIIINNNATSNQQPSLQRQSFLNFNNHHNHHHQQHYQYQQPQQQQAMAHYKFHNDCQSSVLTYEQVKRLDLVMDQTVPIHGRGNFPTLYVKLKELIRLVKYKLQKEHSIEIRDVRLNGGAASYVLAPENSHYNDLDLIFGTDLSNEDQFDVIRDVVLECLKEFYPNEQPHEPFVVDKQLSPTANDSASDGSLVNIAGTKGATDNSNNSGCNSQCRTINCDSERPKIPEMDKGSDKNSEPSSLEQHQQLTEMNKSVMSESEKLNRSNTEKKALKGNDCSKSFEPDRDDNILQQLPNHVQYQQQSYQMPLNSCAIKEAYVHKMVKVNDDDRWSLISLGVQQSEANCCSQSICPSSSTIATTATQRNSQCCMEGKQQPQYRQFSSSNNLAADRESNGSIVNHTNAQMISNENNVAQANFVCGQHNQQLSYVQHQTNRNHYQLHQKQFPNSIELKFVDKMRRKFEFSVDSFQIILDSLIQFYDYAPQSTIASQKILINSHPSSTMINTRPLINKRRSNTCNSNECKSSDKSPVNSNEATRVKRESYESSNNQRAINGFSGAKTCESLSSTQSYYQLPIEPANSPSISSVASSSGCSSSSSVVSSSSSSLSCDEDHEDLYCEADGPSSSSASTSSLLSSTNLSLLSSDGISSATELTSNRDSDQVEDSNSKQTVKRNERADGTASTGCSTNLKTTINKMNSDLSAVDPSLASLNEGQFECTACLGQEESLVNNMYDFETKSKTSCAVISENFYPTVIGRSEYGNFKEALYHLEKKLIATRSPEEIRGGGLLKYCNLLVKNYKPTNVYQIRTLERYMCSRFFIDFSDLNQQQAKLESYLANHFSDGPLLKFDYLTVLHNVVQRSTVCLMNHELRLTLNMIRDLAYKLNEQQEQQNQQQMQHNHNQPQQQQQQQHHQVQQPNLNQPQQHYYQHKPVLIQSGIYRVKLVNYTLAKPAGS